MANVTITKVNAPRDSATEFSLTSLSADDVAVIGWDGKDESTSIVILAGVADVVATIKAGEGIQGMNDLALSLTATKYYEIPINSGKFKNTYGANTGKVLVSVDKACSIAVVEQTK